MATRKLKPSEWQRYFDGVAKHIPSMKVGVTILGEDIGVQPESQGSALVGISWDHNDQALTVDTANWSHRIDRPAEIFVQEEGGMLSSVEVVDQDGSKQIVELQTLPSLPAS
ncbi:MAG: hypothetical protein AMJ62_13735 [Myxococcales bacterium SG8_38]|nr:MAG: hypothetical protein AMJ62_13735 [Myxococcales bacterium SG8_38]